MVGASAPAFGLDTGRPKAMRVTSELKEQKARRYFHFQYEPEMDFDSFRKWCEEPVQGPCWKAVTAKVVQHIRLTDRGGVALISGDCGLKQLYADLSGLYPQTPFELCEDARPHRGRFTRSLQARYPKGSEVHMQISFPREQTQDSGGSGVEFPAIVDGRRIPCKISREALDDHFEAETMGELHAFLKHRFAIEAKARKLIEQQEFQADGSILVGTRDRGPMPRQYGPV